MALSNLRFLDICGSLVDTDDKILLTFSTMPFTIYRNVILKIQKNKCKASKAGLILTLHHA